MVVAEQPAVLDPDGRSRHPDDRGYRRIRLPGPHHSSAHWGSMFKDYATQVKPDAWISLSIPVRSRFLRTRRLRRRSEILETIYGARGPSDGRILVEGRALRPSGVRSGRPTGARRA